MRSPWGHIELLVYNNVSDHSSVCIFNTSTYTNTLYPLPSPHKLLVALTWNHLWTRLYYIEFNPDITSR